MVTAGRITELPGKKGQHGLHHPRIAGRGRIMIEINGKPEHYLIYRFRRQRITGASMHSGCMAKLPYGAPMEKLEVAGGMQRALFAIHKFTGSRVHKFVGYE
jgi:hypothetical protein